MSIQIIEGNLLHSNADIIAHQVNCRGAFNSGVAKAIREFNIEIYNDYRKYCSMNTIEQLLGSVRYFEPDHDNRIFASMFAQVDYGWERKQYTNLKAFRKCLENLHSMSCFGKSIAMPFKIGCVRGGANWNEVYAIISEVLSDREVELWKFGIEVPEDSSFFT